MRKILLFAFLLAGQAAFAQTETLATDEGNKYVVYKVEEVPGAKTATLYQRTLTALKKNYKSKDFKISASPDTLIRVDGKTPVYTSQSTVRHEDGEIGYQLRIEFKDGKYRYLFSNFIYTPYQRNRYGTFEPVPGKQTDLEQVKAKMGQKRFDEYADQLSKYCAGLGKNLKIYAAEPQKSIENTKKVDTHKW